MSDRPGPRRRRGRRSTGERTPAPKERGRERPGARARGVVARVLLDVDSTEVHANVALRAALEETPLEDPRDRALATELVYGVLRWRRRLDFVLEPWVRRGLKRVEPIGRALLRMGAYQVLMLDRIPPAVAVSSTQDAARFVGAGRMTGLLNGVLRRVVSERIPLPEGDSDAAIGVRTSLPDWIVGALRERVGDEVLEAEARALRARAKTTIRPSRKAGEDPAAAVTQALAAEELTCTEAPYGTLMVEGSRDLFATEAFRSGLFVAQDPASVAVIDLLAEGLEPGARVLDLCAGRGVKATGIAERGLHVPACAIHGGKPQVALELAERLGVAERFAISAVDGTDPDAELRARGGSTSFDATPPYDAVLVDAPCTGLGTLRHHPEIAWRRRPSDPARLAELQRSLLRSAATRVAPGGRLLYAVCSFHRREGEMPTPSGFVPEGEPRFFAPSEGVDSFQLRSWRRAT